MTINLLLCFTENWLNPAKVSLYSIAKNTPDADFAVYLLHDSFSEAALAEFSAFARERCRAVLHPIAVPADAFDGCRLGCWPKESYFRLLAPVLLPESVDRVLYTDVDILYLRSIRPLYEQPLGDNVLAGYVDTGEQYSRARLRLPGEQPYINSGVLLLSLRKMRRPDYMAEFARVYKAYEPLLAMPDQDVLNVMYWERILRWPRSGQAYPGNFLRYSRRFAAYQLETKVQLHFITQGKPWMPEYFNFPIANAYRACAEELGWHIKTKYHIVALRELKRFCKILLRKRYLCEEELAWRQNKP